VPDRPDLVLFMTDQQRWDQWSRPSHGLFETPALESLAARGMAFEQGYSGSTTCVPSRVSLLTGLSPHRVPVQPGSRIALQSGFWTVARALQDAGYQTALTGKMHFFPINAEHGFDTLRTCEHLFPKDFTPAARSDPAQMDDYHRWLLDAGYEDWRASRVPDRPPGGPRTLFPLPIEAHPTSWVTREALDVLDRRDPDRPLLLIVSFPHPHDPLNPPEPYASSYDPADVPLPKDGFEVNAGLPSAFLDALTVDDPHWGAARVPSETVLRDALTRVRALIRHIDDGIASIVERLDLERTVVFATSDHGDYGGHRGLLRKIPWIPFEDLARVPLIACAPDVAAPGAAHGGLVQNADIALTFLDYAGVPVRSDEFESRSLRPLLTGAPQPEDLDRTLFVSISSGWPTVRRGSYKYIERRRWGNPGRALFDLDADPGETVDLATDPAHDARREELRTALLEESFRPPGVLDLDWNPAG
jgi:choline-sulfatase